MSGVSAPLVSVVMPVFNAAATVAAALASAQAQTEARLEILVVDDASTDTTAEIVAGIAASDPRVQLLHMPRNGGPAAARNFGMAAAHGTWIALLDADDAYDPRRLQLLLEVAAAHGADMVSDNLLLCGADPLAGSAMIPPALLDAPRHLGAPEFVARNVGDRRYPRVSFGFMKPLLRTDFLREHGLRYDERNRFGEDFLLYVECLMQGAVWWITPEPYYLYTVRAGSLTEVQSVGDLGRIREMERRLLADPRVAADTALRDALRRHKRGIDRNFHYRGFTDAVKARQAATALRLLFSGSESLSCVVRESLVQLPLIVRKASYGGYRTRGARR